MPISTFLCSEILQTVKEGGARGGISLGQYKVATMVSSTRQVLLNASPSEETHESQISDRNRRALDCLSWKCMCVRPQELGLAFIQHAAGITARYLCIYAERISRTRVVV